LPAVTGRACAVIANPFSGKPRDDVADLIPIAADSASS
jgi:hypothetical protein